MEKVEAYLAAAFDLPSLQILRLSKINFRAPLVLISGLMFLFNQESHLRNFSKVLNRKNYLA